MDNDAESNETHERHEEAVFRQALRTGLIEKRQTLTKHGSPEERVAPRGRHDYVHFRYGRTVPAAWCFTGCENRGRYTEAVADQNGLVKLLEELKESLEREVKALDENVERGFDQLNSRFDTQAQRLNRLNTAWSIARPWSHEVDEWRDRMERLIEIKDRQILDLTRRIDALERRPEERRDG